MKRDINPWFMAVTVTLATFMELLDTAVANVSLPHIVGGMAMSYGGKGSLGAERCTRNTSRAFIPWGCGLSRLRFAERPYSASPKLKGRSMTAQDF